MKIGLVGYQGSGKSTLFEWMTGQAADLSLSHTTQSAMATVIDDRVAGLCEIYHPKKVTHAAIEVVDTPGLSRTHEGNAARLSQIREAGSLVHVVPAFLGMDPLAEIRSFEEDLLLTDLEIVSNRAQRIEETLKKPRPNREESEAEMAAIRPILQALEDGQPVRDLELSDEQLKATRSFQLLTLKRQLAIINVADDETDLGKYDQLSTRDRSVFAVPVGLETELARMQPEERDEFLQEMGIQSYDRNALIRAIMDRSGQMLFFTAGEKEVRTWIIPKQCTAVQAADCIHSDLARGFIRAETMNCADLIRLGSEREVKAQNLMRQEPKDYIIQDGDILNIRFSV